MWNHTWIKIKIHFWKIFCPKVWWMLPVLFFFNWGQLSVSVLQSREFCQSTFLRILTPWIWSSRYDWGCQGYSSTILCYYFVSQQVCGNNKQISRIHVRTYDQLIDVSLNETQLLKDLGYKGHRILPIYCKSHLFRKLHFQSKRTDFVPNAKIKIQPVNHPGRFVMRFYSIHSKMSELSWPDASIMDSPQVLESWQKEVSPIIISMTTV